jgi:hypothetical protein
MVIIHLTHYEILVYYVVISIHLKWKKISDLHLYSSNIRSAFIFNNIRIHVYIRFENMKTNIKRAISNPLPPLGPR